MAKKQQKTPPILPFKSPEFAETWELYLKHRREKGSSNYTDTGLNMVFKKLLRLSNGIENVSIRILEQSIENNWTGIFELKLEKNDRSTTYWQSIGKGRVDNTTIETPI